MFREHYLNPRIQELTPLIPLKGCSSQQAVDFLENIEYRSLPPKEDIPLQIKKMARLFESKPFIKEIKIPKSRSNKFSDLIFLIKNPDYSYSRIKIFLTSQQNHTFPNLSETDDFLIDDQEDEHSIISEFYQKLKLAHPSLIESKFNKQIADRFVVTENDEFSWQVGVRSLQKVGDTLLKIPNLVNIEVIPPFSYDDVKLYKDLTITLIGLNKNTSLLNNIDIQVKSSKGAIKNFLTKFDNDPQQAWKKINCQSLVLLNGSSSEKKILLNFNKQLRRIDPNLISSSC